MRLIVGLTKKVGLPGFGSLAATCQLESDEHSSTPSSGDFARRVERAFASCRDAVEAELRRHQSNPQHDAEHQPAAGQPTPNGNGMRPATTKQLNALRALASKSRLSRQELDQVFGGKPLAALTVGEASSAIDRLNGITAVAGVNGRKHFEGGT